VEGRLYCIERLIMQSMAQLLAERLKAVRDAASIDTGRRLARGEIILVCVAVNQLIGCIC
jgi:hypothetical protein